MMSQSDSGVHCSKQQLAARHIKVIMTGMAAAASTRDPDDQHFNAQGHAAVAAALVPRVLAAMPGK